jgi:DNA-binding GntR family transcriptional regulator
MYSKFEQHFSTPELRALSLSDHQTIFAALARRDARAARKAMRSHLDRVHKEFSRTWNHQPEGVTLDRGAAALHAGNVYAVVPPDQVKA